MKLVEILAREMNEWPEGILWITQDGGTKKGRIVGFNSDAPEFQDAHYWGAKGGGDWYPELKTNADDYRTAIITREMWQAERDRIGKVPAMTEQQSRAISSAHREAYVAKPNKDGWIRHRGGKQPVGDDVRVEYRLRGGMKYKDDAANLDWSHDGDTGDIMAYKPLYSGFEAAPMIEAPKKPEALVLDYSPSLHIQSFGRAYRHEGDPRTIRDRIREIDAATIALSEERASLVAKLKAEGFVLIQSDPANSELESAQQDIAQQDMSDWRNWKEGDLVSAQSNSIGGYGDHFSKGDLYPVTAVDTDDPACPIEVDALWFRANELHQIKWHSRPTT